MFFEIQPSDITAIKDNISGLVGDLMPLIVIVLGILLVGLIIDIIFSLRK